MIQDLLSCPPISHLIKGVSQSQAELLSYKEEGTLIASSCKGYIREPISCKLESKLAPDV